jgi:hypothetical protein
MVPTIETGLPLRRVRRFTRSSYTPNPPRSQSFAVLHMTMQLSYSAIATNFQQWQSRMGDIISPDGFHSLSIGERIDLLTAALGPEPGTIAQQEQPND